MILHYFKQVYFTDSGPHRPYAKASFERTAEDILTEWENNQETLRKMKSDGVILGHMNFIDMELLEKELDLTKCNLSFSDDMRYCLIRKKYVPEGKVKDRYVLEILEQVKEEVLSPEDESFIEKLKEFQERGGMSLLKEQSADILAIATIGDHFDCYYPNCEYIESLWTVNYGPFDDYLDKRIIKYSLWGRGFDHFELVVRAALYQSETVDKAIELIDSFCKDCRGRRLTDEELLKFHVNVEKYHKNWPFCYIGEKAGFYFVTYDFNCQASGVTKNPEEFEAIIGDAGYTAWALAAYSGGGYYRCGGAPV